MRKSVKMFLGSVILCVCVVPFVDVKALTHVMNEEELTNALAGTETEIVLGTNITTTDPISVTRDVTIDGTGQFGITANYAGGAGDRSILTAQPGATLTLKNIVLSNSPKYGVQAYNGGTVILDGVRIQNSGFGAALINGQGTIVVKDLDLWNNAYGIEFGLGDQASGTPSLIIDGTIDFTNQTTGDKLYVALEDNVPAVNVETTANAPYEFVYENGVFTLNDNNGNSVATSNNVADANVKVNVTNEEPTTPEEPTVQEPTTPAEDTDSTKAEEITNPKTADSILLITLALLASGSVAVVAGRKLVKQRM